MSVISLDEWRKKQESTSSSKSQSMQNTPSDEHGQILTEAEVEGLIGIAIVIQKAHHEPFTTKSDFARMAATEIALCACEGLITTKISDVKFGNVWVVTAEGLEYLNEVSDVLGL